MYWQCVHTDFCLNVILWYCTHRQSKMFTFLDCLHNDVYKGQPQTAGGGMLCPLSHPPFEMVMLFFCISVGVLTHELFSRNIFILPRCDEGTAPSESCIYFYPRFLTIWRGHVCKLMLTRPFVDICMVFFKMKRFLQLQNKHSKPILPCHKISLQSWLGKLCDITPSDICTQQTAAIFFFSFYFFENLLFYWVIYFEVNHCIFMSLQI